MNTEIKRFYGMIKKKGEMSFSDAAQTMKVSPEVIEAWAKALEDKKMVEISYPLNPVESPLVKHEEKPEEKKKKKKKITKKTKKKETEGVHSWRK